MKILVIEDERDLNNVITRYLKKSGYSVDSAINGEDAVDFVQMSEYDIILLDIMMPIMNGYDFIDYLRKERIDTPVIFLTAKSQVEDKIKGLNLGADDYIVKPFSFDELIARINAIIRRRYGKQNNIVNIGELSIDMSSKVVKVDNSVIELTSKEYAVLEYLIHNKNKIVSRDQIRNHAWDFEYEGESNIIDVLIKNIRKKIGENEERKFIYTKRGMGYVIKDK